MTAGIPPDDPEPPDDPPPEEPAEALVLEPTDDAALVLEELDVEEFAVEEFETSAVELVVTGTAATIGAQEGRTSPAPVQYGTRV